MRSSGSEKRIDSIRQGMGDRYVMRDVSAIGRAKPSERPVHFFFRILSAFASIFFLSAPLSFP